MPILRQKLTARFILPRAALALAILFALTLFWLSLGSAASNRWPSLYWPNPARYTMSVSASDGKDAAAATNLVHARPLSAASLATLAYHLQKTGKATEAVPVLGLAGQMGWRNPVVQSFWAKVALLAGDWTVAAQRVDALLRIEASDDLWQSHLNQLLSNPAGLKAMTVQAKADPTWLSQQFVAVEGDNFDPNDLRNRLNLLANVYQSGTAPHCGPLARITNATVSNSLAQRGERLWTAYCDPKARIAGGGRNLSSAANEDDTNSKFVWSPLSTGLYGVNMTTTDDGGQAIHVIGSSSIRETVARRILALAPGVYRLSWTAKSDTGRPVEGVGFNLACQGGVNILSPSADTDADPDSGSGDPQIEPTNVQFQIPSQGCDAQTISLMIDKPRSAMNDTDMYVSHIVVKPLR